MINRTRDYELVNIFHGQKKSNTSSTIKTLLQPIHQSQQEQSAIPILYRQSQTDMDNHINTVINQEKMFNELNQTQKIIMNYSKLDVEQHQNQNIKQFNKQFGASLNYEKELFDQMQDTIALQNYNMVELEKNNQFKDSEILELKEEINRLLSKQRFRRDKYQESQGADHFDKFSLIKESSETFVTQSLGDQQEVETGYLQSLINISENHQLLKIEFQELQKQFILQRVENQSRIDEIKQLSSIIKLKDEEVLEINETISEQQLQISIQQQQMKKNEDQLAYYTEQDKTIQELHCTLEQYKSLEADYLKKIEKLNQKFEPEKRSLLEQIQEWKAEIIPLRIKATELKIENQEYLERNQQLEEKIIQLEHQQMVLLNETQSIKSKIANVKSQELDILKQANDLRVVTYKARTYINSFDAKTQEFWLPIRQKIQQSISQIQILNELIQMKERLLIEAQASIAKKNEELIKLECQSSKQRVQIQTTNQQVEMFEVQVRTQLQRIEIIEKVNKEQQTKIQTLQDQLLQLGSTEVAKLYKQNEEANATIQQLMGEKIVLQTQINKSHQNRFDFLKPLEQPLLE